MRFVESKRLGRTLPAVINGLTAAQAQTHGFIEVPSDPDVVSVANSEPLFVGESDDEITSSPSRSGSPQKIRDVDSQPPQLNPAASPFDPNPTTSTAPARPNPFAAVTTFGKPSGTQIQTNSTPIFDFRSSSTNKVAPNAFESKELPKFSFFPPGSETKAEESKVTPSVLGSKEPSRRIFFPSQLAPEPDDNSNGSVPSSSAPPMDKRPTFGQPSTPFSASPVSKPTEAVVEKSSISNEAAVSSRPRSVFDQPAASSVPHVFSFGTSPLFEAARKESESRNDKTGPAQASEEKALDVSAPQQEPVTIQSPNLTTPSTSKSSPFSLLPPSNPMAKEMNLPRAAPFKFPASNDALLRTPETQSNSTPSQHSSIFPPSTTPKFSPPLASPSPKTFATTHSMNLTLEPTSSSPQGFSSSSNVKRSEFQSSSRQSTSAPSPLDPKSIALDKLSNIMLLEDNGIMQHFIEYTIGPIIKASIAQFDDESSWKEASQSSTSGFGCGEQMLIGNRGMSCSFVGQEVL